MKLSIISFVPKDLVFEGGLIVSIPMRAESLSAYVEAIRNEGWKIENDLDVLTDDDLRSAFPGIDIPKPFVDVGFPWDGEGEAILVSARRNTSEDGFEEKTISAARVIHIRSDNPTYPSIEWLGYVKEIAY
jgi:hypothetical protein